MNVVTDYLALVERIAAGLDLPAVSRVHIDTREEFTHNSSKFGAILLEDGSAGLTYVALEGARQALSGRDVSRWSGKPVTELALLYAQNDIGDRVLGWAGINAISQHLFRRSGFELAESLSTLEILNPNSEDRFGMVGYFPPLVQKIRDLKLPLTVIELDPQWLQAGDRFEVTQDPGRLNRCNKIVCTGTVMINQSFDDLVGHMAHAEQVVMVGPTVGCLPDPLFHRGVTAVGGRSILDSEQFGRSWQAGLPWNDCSQRYLIDASSYPGLETLLNGIV